MLDAQDIKQIEHSVRTIVDDKFEQFARIVNEGFTGVQTQLTTTNDRLNHVELKLTDRLDHIDDRIDKLYNLIEDQLKLLQSRPA